MKIIILAGGWGTRLGQHTEWIPKPMVQIGDRPIIWHIMKGFAQAGYNDFVISAGVKSHVLKEYFINYDAYSKDFTKDFSTNNTEFHGNTFDIDWRVTVVDTGQNTLKGARIKRVEQYLSPGANVVTYGDGLCDVDIKTLLKFHSQHGKLVTITGVHPPSRFGEIYESDNVVHNFTEKPQTSVGLINGGYIVFSPGLLEYLSVDPNCELEAGVLESLTKETEVMVYKHDGSWECIDHERDLIHLNHLWSTGNAFWKTWDD